MADENISKIASEYDMTSIMQNIGVNYFGSKISTERIGMFGHLTESMAHMFGAAVIDASIRANEFNILTAKKRETLMYEASILGMNVANATPTTMTVYLGILTNNITKPGNQGGYGTPFTTPGSSFPDTYILVLEKDAVIHIGNYNFMFERDIQIKATYNSIISDYTFSVKYLDEGDTDPTSLNGTYVYPKANYASVLNNKYIQSYVAGYGDTRQLVFKVDLKQIEKDTQYYTVVKNDMVSLTGIDFFYNNQLSHFNIYYKKRGSNTWKYIRPVLIYDTTLYNEDIIYYEVFHGNNKIRLNLTDFTPEYNSEFRIDIYTTIGSEVNGLVYSGYGSDINTVLNTFEDRHSYSGLELSCKPISSAHDGSDVPDMETLRTKLVRLRSSLNSLDTDYDILNYLIERDPLNDYLPIKKRSDVRERRYSIFTIPRLESKDIISSSTMNLCIPNMLSSMKYNSDEYSYYTFTEYDPAELTPQSKVFYMYNNHFYGSGQDNDIISDTAKFYNPIHNRILNDDFTSYYSTHPNSCYLKANGYNTYILASSYLANSIKYVYYNGEFAEYDPENSNHAALTKYIKNPYIPSQHYDFIESDIKTNYIKTVAEFMSGGQLVLDYNISHGQPGRVVRYTKSGNDYVPIYGIDPVGENIYVPDIYVSSIPRYTFEEDENGTFLKVPNSDSYYHPLEMNAASAYYLVPQEYDRSAGIRFSYVEDENGEYVKNSDTGEYYPYNPDDFIEEDENGNTIIITPVRYRKVTYYEFPSNAVVPDEVYHYYLPLTDYYISMAESETFDIYIPNQVDEISYVNGMAQNTVTVDGTEYTIYIKMNKTILEQPTDIYADPYYDITFNTQYTRYTSEYTTVNTLGNAYYYKDDNKYFYAMDGYINVNDLTYYGRYPITPANPYNNYIYSENDGIYYLHKEYILPEYSLTYFMNEDIVNGSYVYMNNGDILAIVGGMEITKGYIFRVKYKKTSDMYGSYIYDTDNYRYFRVNNSFNVYGVQYSAASNNNTLTIKAGIPMLLCKDINRSVDYSSYIYTCSAVANYYKYEKDLENKRFYSNNTLSIFNTLEKGYDPNIGAQVFLYMNPDNTINTSAIIDLEKSQKLFSIPYTIAYNSKEQTTAFYLTSINEDVPMNMIAEESSTPINFAIDHINIYRNTLMGDASYKITVDIMPNGEYTNAIFDTNINVEEVANAIILKGFVYNSSGIDIDGYFDFKFESFSDNIFRFSAVISIDDSLTDTKCTNMANLYNMSDIKVPDGSNYDTYSKVVNNLTKLYKYSSLGETTNQSYLNLNVFSTKIGIGCYYLDREAANQYGEFTSTGKVSVILDTENTDKAVKFPVGGSNNIYPNFLCACTYTANDGTETVVMEPYIICNVYDNSNSLINLYTDMSEYIKTVNNIAVYDNIYSPSATGEYIYDSNINEYIIPHIVAPDPDDLEQTYYYKLKGLSVYVDDPNEIYTFDNVLRRYVVYDKSIYGSSAKAYEVEITEGGEPIKYIRYYEDGVPRFGNTSIANQEYIFFTDIPVIQYSKCVDQVQSTRIIDIFKESSEIMSGLNKRLNNNFSIDYKVFRTYGPCRYFKLNKILIEDEDTDIVNLENLDIKITFNVLTRNDLPISDNELINQLKQFIKANIESLNRTDDDYTIYISNVITDIETQFKEYVKSVELVSINDFDNHYRVIRYTKPDFGNNAYDVLTKSGIREYVPEYVNLPVENITINITR